MNYLDEFTWLDTGTHNLVNGNSKLCKNSRNTSAQKDRSSLEEIAYLNHWITKDQLLIDIEPLKKTSMDSI